MSTRGGEVGRGEGVGTQLTDLFYYTYFSGV